MSWRTSKQAVTFMNSASAAAKVLIFLYVKANYWYTLYIHVRSCNEYALKAGAVC